MHDYDKKLNGKIGYCECCFEYKDLIQHHIEGRRYSNKCIWICDDCHKEIHANPEWSYKNHFMEKHNSLPVGKRTKDKRCSHSKSYWKNGIKICQLCNKKIT